MPNLRNPQKPSGPVESKEVIIEVNRDLCIGAATCVALAGKAFVLDEQGKAVILETVDEETREMLLEAARSCPVAAIILKTKSGEKIFPA